MHILKVIAALGLAIFPASAHEPTQARYLGNEGILVAHGQTKVLFDAFYAESFAGQYTLVPADVERAIMKGRPPFDGVDAIFISHIHPDHFNSRKTIAYLRAHPNVMLYAGLDVIGAIKAADVANDDPLLKHVVPINLAPGKTAAHFDIEELEIEAYSIPHTHGVPVLNYAFRVTLDHVATVFHLGDAGSDERDYAPYQADFDRKHIDLVFAPFWMLQDAAGKRVLEQRMRPMKTVGIHVPASARKDPGQARQQVGGDLFVEPGETRALDEARR